MWWRKAANNAATVEDVVTKRIVVLANSWKTGGRCVAGREVSVGRAGTVPVGGWVRPVSTVGEGELSQDHYTLEGGGTARVLDIVEVPCLAHADDPMQPENWIIGTSRKWKRVGQFKKADLRTLAEQPQHLWLSGERRTDSIAHALLSANPPEQSLYLVHLPEATVVPDTRSGFRLRFMHCGVGYELKITDPKLRDYFGFALDDEGGVVLHDAHACLSLGGEFNGYHYKLVATLFP